MSVHIHNLGVLHPNHGHAVSQHSKSVFLCYNIGLIGKTDFFSVFIRIQLARGGAQKVILVQAQVTSYFGISVDIS
jgi:hypothetical protein